MDGIEKRRKKKKTKHHNTRKHQNQSTKPTKQNKPHQMAWEKRREKSGVRESGEKVYRTLVEWGRRREVEWGRKEEWLERAEK